MGQDVNNHFSVGRFVVEMMMVSMVMMMMVAESFHWLSSSLVSYGVCPPNLPWGMEPLDRLPMYTNRGRDSRGGRRLPYLTGGEVGGTLEEG